MVEITTGLSSHEGDIFSFPSFVQQPTKFGIVYIRFAARLNWHISCWLVCLNNWGIQFWILRQNYPESSSLHPPGSYKKRLLKDSLGKRLIIWIKVFSRFLFIITPMPFLNTLSVTKYLNWKHFVTLFSIMTSIKNRVSGSN